MNEIYTFDNFIIETTYFISKLPEQYAVATDIQNPNRPESRPNSHVMKHKTRTPKVISIIRFYGHSIGNDIFDLLALTEVLKSYASGKFEKIKSFDNNLFIATLATKGDLKTLRIQFKNIQNNPLYLTSLDCSILTSKLLKVLSRIEPLPTIEQQGL